MLLSQLAQKAKAGMDLTSEEAAAAIDAMIHQDTEDTVKAEFLIALAEKGETHHELAGAA
jgi:anthranilate phosphoribosyltransferase